MRRETRRAIARRAGASRLASRKGCEGCVQCTKRHDLAPLSRDMRAAPGRWQKYNDRRNGLILNVFCAGSGARRVLGGRCGTLTYRQEPKAKRQPCHRIAAAQQTQVRTGARRCGGKRNEPIGFPVGMGLGERQAAAHYHDVLGFVAAIGLIRFVRSASSRG